MTPDMFNDPMAAPPVDPAMDDPMDDAADVYHGTHCAGTIGGIGNNGEGVAGVNWNVRIMAVKFLSSGGSGWTTSTFTVLASGESTALMFKEIGTEDSLGMFLDDVQISLIP